jgi:hypothetical protein
VGKARTDTGQEAHRFLRGVHRATLLAAMDRRSLSANRGSPPVSAMRGAPSDKIPRSQDPKEESNQGDRHGILMPAPARATSKSVAKIGLRGHGGMGDRSPQRHLDTFRAGCREKRPPVIFQSRAPRAETLSWPTSQPARVPSGGPALGRARARPDWLLKRVGEGEVTEARGQIGQKALPSGNHHQRLSADVGTGAPSWAWAKKALATLQV